MKKIILTLLALVLTLSFILVSCGSVDDESAEGELTPSDENTAPEDFEGDYTVELKIKDYGTITLELDSDTAPITVENFVTLARDGFYDGLTFHRIIENFMIQGGDPEGTGFGGSDKEIEGEFSSNGYINNLKHTRGAISMARSKAPNSASSQFFIVHKDSPHLNGDYACFGYVTKGMNIVDKICADAEPTDNNGSIPKSAQPKIESVTVTEK
ncbi:MAG: peptidylprolyl isomerase [Clostridia bacterium]|nr:peptidylprolyl isomerase [Clostridia bacterium]